MSILPFAVILVIAALASAKCVSESVDPLPSKPDCSLNNENWQIYEGSRYYIQNQPDCWLSWSDAQNFCRSVDGHLASIDSWSEGKHLGYFIGAWAVWISGAADQPKEANKCLQMSTSPRMSGINYYWVDCDAKSGFVCERPAAKGNSIKNAASVDSSFKQ